MTGICKYWGEAEGGSTEWRGWGEQGCPEGMGIGCVCTKKQGCLCLQCREGHVSPSFGMLGSCRVVSCCCSVCTCGGGSPGEPLGQSSELLQLGLAARRVFRGSGVDLGLDLGGGFGATVATTSLENVLGTVGGYGRGDRDGSPELQKWRSLLAVLSELWELC